MALQPFTDNFADNSTEAGFQFTFFCDLCREGYKTGFTESKTYKKTGWLRGLGQAISAGATLVGKYNVGSSVERGIGALTERFHGMSPEWQKEHEAAFNLAQAEAQGHFHRCPKCKKWACDNDWNEQAGLCVDDGPRESVEVQAARAAKMVEDIKAKAENAVIFRGRVEERLAACPSCGKPAGQGRFCNNCGAALDLKKCPKCQANNSAESRFCSSCGGPLG